MGVVMALTRELEIWAMAMWVDREHGEDGERFIAERVLYFDAEGDEGGKQLWMDVGRRFGELSPHIDTASN